MSLVSISGYSKLKKDLSNGGVVNVDVNAYKAHKEARERALKQLHEQQAVAEQVTNMQEQIADIHGEISEIKTLLKQLLSK
jgi:TolA-binding protein